MKARSWFPIALTLALASVACGDDDGVTSTETDPFANAGARSSTGGTRGFGVAGSTGSAGIGATTIDAGARMPGAGADAAGAMAPMMDPMKKPMTEMCPDAMPLDGEACEGKAMCMFGSLECRCRRKTWDCGGEVGEMMPDAMMPDAMMDDAVTDDADGGTTP